MKIEVYSDGSSNGKSGGIGGWAFVVVLDGVKVHEDSGSESNATNNICEVLAASKGLEYVDKHYPQGLQQTEVELISDSQLALNWATGEYSVKKWHLLPYVITLRNAMKATNAKTRWVKGHNGDEHNETCDKLAKAARTAVTKIP